VKWSGNIYKVIFDYKKEFRKFSKELCQPGDEKKYWELLRNYHGQGYYLPQLNDDIDRKAIKKNLHHFQKKINYIAGLHNTLLNQKNFPNFKLMHNEMEQIINELLNYKKLYRQELIPSKKAKIKLESSRTLLKLKKQFKIFMDQVFFLKSYNFPNDYLAYREEFEKYKYDPEHIDKHKANTTYFFRKIVEDGAHDPNHTRGDKFMRMALDTLYLNIQKEKDFLSEEVRYDYEWIDSSIERMLNRGRAVQLARIKEWLNRTKKTYEFYQELLKTKSQKKARYLVKKENENSQLLKEFVYRKQGEVYNYWANKSELHRALFVLDTILVNEVGVIDGKFGLERKSVAYVVFNRFFDDYYNQLNHDQYILPYISDEIDTSEKKWLNVLFKTGEFSFTYHYISAVVKTFCPDMSRRGKSVRAENLKIILKALKQYEPKKFPAFRYFSRISMNGKIDMSSVWTGYERLPEMVGYESSQQQKLMRYYLADEFKFLYSFKDDKGTVFSVVEIDDETYSMRWEKGKPKFYDYRNPHLFAYFSRKK
tara:strand:- start:5366 stop:6976 length:1611 start_codon:yes stop_codon:yes gene_type:complete